MKKLVKTTVIVSALTLLSTPVLAQNQFTDISEQNPYASYINDLTDKGVVSGVDVTHFAPTQPLTRAQFATLMVKAFNLPASKSHRFVDARGHWAEAYINAAADANVVSGTSPNTFNPDAPLRREEAAQMIWNYLANHGVKATQQAVTETSGTDNWAKVAVANILADHLYGPEVTGSNGVYNYKSQAVMTRQEMAALLDLSMKFLVDNAKQGGNGGSVMPPMPPVIGGGGGSVGGGSVGGGSTGGSTGGTVTKQGDVYNPTSNSNNLVQNADGTYSPGNIKMDVVYQQGISSSQFDTNMKLFAQVKIITNGQNATITVPSTGSSMVWTVGGGSIINGKPIKSSTPDYKGNGPTTLTFSDATSIGIALIDGPKVRGSLFVVYQNGQWSVKY